MTRPLLLDLFCGAGGAAKGYHDAGFDVIGVDINPQPNYPFKFYRDDALEWLKYEAPESSLKFDAIHASPPCQFYSGMSNCRPGLADDYPDLIGPTRQLLERTGLPWVIENVPLARPWMRDPVTLCGFMFGRELYRHRLFEASFPLVPPPHPTHSKPGGRAGHWRPGEVISISGHCSPMWLAREVMEISWSTRAELAEAIPPYFSDFVGRQLLEHIDERKIV